MTGERDPIEADVSGLRRLPRQARARQKLAAVLATADRLLVAEGPEALTTTRVAAEAGISVGALYRYLPDRDAIIDMLAEQYLTRLEALMDSLVDRASHETWPDPVALLVDAFAELYGSESGFRALWFGRHLTERTREADRKHKFVMAAGAHRVLVAQCVLPDDGEAKAACYTAFLAADAVIQEVFREYPDGDSDLLRHLKTMLHAYVEHLTR